MTIMKKLILGWIFEFAFDAIISYGEKVAARTDTDLDDDAVRKFKTNRAVFIKYAKGKL